MMKPKRDTHNVWPYAIAAALTCVVLAYAVMIRISLRHPSAPAADDHYAEAERYDSVLAERRRAEALGWKIQVGACREGLHAGVCRVEVGVEDPRGSPLSGLSGTLGARRSDDASWDRDGELHATGPGRYTTDLALGRGGFYTLEIRLQGPQGTWVGAREALIDEGVR